MINEIIHEFEYWFWMVIIIAFGMCFCDIGNREATWNEWYQNYEHNLNPSEDNGWIDSIVKPD